MFVSDRGIEPTIYHQMEWCKKNCKGKWRADQEPHASMVEGYLMFRPINAPDVVRHYTITFWDDDDAFEFWEKHGGATMDMTTIAPSYLPSNWKEAII